MVIPPDEYEDDEDDQDDGLRALERHRQWRDNCMRTKQWGGPWGAAAAQDGPCMHVANRA